MRCLVTGGAGFFGSALLSQLLQHGETVILLLRPSSNLSRIRHLLPHAQVVVGDIRDIATVKNDIVKFRPDVVLHLAWSGGNSGRYQNDPAQIENNLPSAINLLQIASEAGAHRWIGIGSGFEYGQLTGVLTESTQPQPNTMYAISKYALCLGTAKLCALLGMEHLWVRPFATYGAGDDPHGLLPFVTQTLLRGERPSLTAGEQEWDYLHVEDAAYALMLLMLAPDVHGVYNLASGKAQTIRCLVEHLRDMIDPRLPLGFGEIAYHPDQIMNLRADVSKLKAAINWQPQVTLEEGLRGVINEFPSSSKRSGKG